MTNEENARDIVREILAEYPAVRNAGLIHSLTTRIVDSLAEVELITPEDEEFVTLYGAFIQYHGCPDSAAAYNIRAGKVQVNGKVVKDVNHYLRSGDVVQSDDNRFYATFIV